MTQLQKLEALATKYEEEARVLRKVIRLLKKQNHVEPEKKVKKHWTQKPENKEKLSDMIKKSWKARRNNDK